MGEGGAVVQAPPVVPAVGGARAPVPPVAPGVGMVVAFPI